MITLMKEDWADEAGETGFMRSCCSSLMLSEMSLVRLGSYLSLLGLDLSVVSDSDGNRENLVGGGERKAG